MDLSPNDRVVVPLLGAPSVCRVLRINDDSSVLLQDEQSKRIFTVQTEDITEFLSSAVSVTNYADFLLTKNRTVRFPSAKADAEREKRKRARTEKRAAEHEKRTAEEIANMSPEDAMRLIERLKKGQR